MCMEDGACNARMAAREAVWLAAREAVLEAVWEAVLEAVWEAVAGLKSRVAWFSCLSAAKVGLAREGPHHQASDRRAGQMQAAAGGGSNEGGKGGRHAAQVAVRQGALLRWRM